MNTQGKRRSNRFLPTCPQTKNPSQAKPCSLLSPTPRPSWREHWEPWGNSGENVIGSYETKTAMHIRKHKSSPARLRCQIMKLFKRFGHCVLKVRNCGVLRAFAVILRGLRSFVLAAFKNVAKPKVPGPSTGRRHFQVTSTIATPVLGKGTPDAARAAEPVTAALWVLVRLGAWV